MPNRRFFVQNVGNPPRDAPRVKCGSFRAFLAKSRFFDFWTVFDCVSIAKIAPFPINGGSGGELEFWCVISKCSHSHNGPVRAIFTGVPERETRFPDFGPFYVLYIAKIAPFPINGGSGGELEFWCVISKCSHSHIGPAEAIFTGVP